MNAQATSLKAIDKNINIVGNMGNKFNLIVHTTAMMILKHAEEHGDCTRALNLVKKMPASMRRTMLVAWFEKYSPIRVVLTNDKVGMLKEKAKGYTPFDIEGAEAEPFYELANQTPENTNTYDFQSLVKMVESLSKAIAKKIDDGKVPETDVASARMISQRLSSLHFKPVNDTDDEEGVIKDTDVEPARPVRRVAKAA